jgi:hypothetical protein
MRKIKIAIGIIALLLIVASGIGTLDMIPIYAPVYLDDASQTYFAPSCLNEWQHRTGTSAVVARRSTVAEAAELHYAPDHVCAQTGAFSEDGRSVFGLLLVKLGILHPLKHWWDMPYGSA